MSIDVTCQGCSKAYSVPDERAGQRFKCKACGTVVSVPADEWGFDSGNAAFGGNTSTGGSAAGFADPHNPYAAPLASGTGTNRIGRAEALSKTNICAIFLYILAALSIPTHGVSAVFTIVGGNADGPGMRAPANDAERAGRMVGGLAGLTIFLRIREFG